MKKYTIYVLKLVQGKWYVGRTTDIHKRYILHKKGKGSAWTRIYRPLKGIHFEYKEESPFDEDKTTKEYMLRYGIDNVRGGIFVQPKLPIHIKKRLQEEIWAAMDYCVRCGSPDHFIKNCPHPPHPPHPLPSTEPSTEPSLEQEKNILDIPIFCAYCGKSGHTISECSERCIHCGQFSHKGEKCWKRCYICNTFGHIAKDCVLL